MDITSPGEAIARQRASEAVLTIAAEEMMRRFLAGVRDAAHSGALYPPNVSSRWALGVANMLEGLPSEMTEYLASTFLDSDIPDDVYATVQAVFAAGRANYATDGERNAAIDRALSPDGFEVEQISASAAEFRNIPIETFNLVAAGYWDSLKETGSVWIKRIRKITRTGATGLSGWTTITVMRLQDYPLKRWVTRHDDRVRHSHAEADGQTVPVGSPFTVGGWQLQYPGDRNAELGETVNCRCVLVGVK